MSRFYRSPVRKLLRMPLRLFGIMFKKTRVKALADCDGLRIALRARGRQKIKVASVAPAHTVKEFVALA